MNLKLIFLCLFLLILVLFVLDLFLGSVSLNPTEIIAAVFNKSDDVTSTILMKFRLPKAITSVIVGVALSVSGLQMQTLFKNPMAGPDVLGISSGASLGVAFVVLGFQANLSPGTINLAGNWAIVAASWIGAGVVMIFIMSVSSRVKNIMTVLILGIMLSFGITAVVSIMQYFSNETMLKTYIIWTMGSLGNLSSSQLGVMTVSVLAGIIISFISVKMMNALLLGEDYAKSIGLNIRLSRILIITGTSILSGTIMAFCGPIGFIGIAVPHLARILLRTADHNILIPGSIFIGASIMLLSDIISQLPGSGNILPINSVTSLIGIPVVIWVIIRNQKYGEIF